MYLALCSRFIFPAVSAVAVILQLALPVHAAEGRQLEKLWLTAGLRVPESALVYQNGKEKYLFVTEIDGKDDDGEGGVARLSLDGKILEQDWVRGLNGPKGMGAHKGKLYVADVKEVVVIDIDSGDIDARIPVADAVFLNDIAVDINGVVYVSDTRTNKVHRIVNNNVELYLDNITSPNGLQTIGSTLIVGAATRLLLIDKDKNLLTLAKGFESNIDGVEMTQPGEFIVSCWAGLVYYVHADGRIEKLLDSRDTQINTADIGFDEDTRIVYIPNFHKNSLTAYQLK
ncbi:GTP-binding protein [Cellvibrio sp. ARAG 10.3]|uniref:GTP-binding protein n=1 Tax=Cellvibrio sp. ARAG 10.3 TaxID=3451358 RepID=UPI003F45108D